MVILSQLSDVVAQEMLISRNGRQDGCLLGADEKEGDAWVHETQVPVNLEQQTL